MCTCIQFTDGHHGVLQHWTGQQNLSRMDAHTAISIHSRFGNSSSSTDRDELHRWKSLPTNTSFQSEALCCAHAPNHVHENIPRDGLPRKVHPSEELMQRLEQTLEKMEMRLEEKVVARLDEAFAAIGERLEAAVSRGLASLAQQKTGEGRRCVHAEVSAGRGKGWQQAEGAAEVEEMGESAGAASASPQPRPADASPAQSAGRQTASVGAPKRSSPRVVGRDGSRRTMLTERGLFDGPEVGVFESALFLPSNACCGALTALVFSLDYAACFTKPDRDDR